MMKICLKDRKEVVLREANKEDGRQMIEFYNIVGGETDFLSFGKDEFIRDLKEYENYIEATKDEVNSIILLAIIGEKIIGIASISSSQKERTKHVGTLGIVVSKEYCSLGLGRKMIDYLIEWSNSNGITKKISLVTREDNLRAIELYKKAGFVEEGRLDSENYINGAYYNTLIMRLFI